MTFLLNLQSHQPPSASLLEQLYVMATSEKIHSRFLSSKNQQESHSATFENVTLCQDYSNNDASLLIQTTRKFCTRSHCAPWSATSPTFLRRKSQYPSPLQVFSQYTPPVTSSERHVQYLADLTHCFLLSNLSTIT